MLAHRKYKVHCCLHPLNIFCPILEHIVGLLRQIGHHLCPEESSPVPLIECLLGGRHLAWITSLNSHHYPGWCLSFPFHTRGTLQPKGVTWPSQHHATNKWQCWKQLSSLGPQIQCSFHQLTPLPWGCPHVVCFEKKKKKQCIMGVNLVANKALCSGLHVLLSEAVGRQGSWAQLPAALASAHLKRIRL